MKNKFIVSFLGSLLSLNGFGQIWDYPPMPVLRYEPNSTIKRDNVEVLKIYQYKLENGVRTGEKTLLTEQHFDSLGVTVLLIENSTDTVNYSTSTRQIDESVIEYDHLGRVIKQISGQKSSNWIYQNDRLKESYVTVSGKIIEKRTYEYKGNNVLYSKCYFFENNETECDTVTAIMNKNNQPLKIISESQYGQKKVRNVMTVEYDDAGNNLGGQTGCERIQFRYSKTNYRTQLLRFACDGKLIEDQEYEYIWYE